MSFTQETFATVGAQSTDTPNLYSYKSDDSIATILGEDYFIDKFYQLTAGDFILIYAADSSGLYEVNSSKTGVTPTSGSIIYKYEDTDSSDVNINLLPGINNLTYKVVNTGSSGNRVSVIPNGTDLLFGENETFYLYDDESIYITYQATEGWR